MLFRFMNILAGRNFYNHFSQEVTKVCPDCYWTLLEPDGSWSGLPSESKLAVLIDDAYCQQFKDSILKATHIEWVHTENTGIDGPFYQELLSRDILLTNSPGANAPEVAEFVFAVILRATKSLGILQLQQQAGVWKRQQLQSLYDRKILVLGLGAIGSRVARIAKFFNMYVLGIRRTNQHTEGVDELGRLAELPEYLPQADIIVLALPLSSDTEHLISDVELGLMKDTVLLVNVARGQLIDTDALKKHLLNKPNMQACLDVISPEPLPANDELWHFPNVFITPHIAWSSPLFRPRAAKIWLNNLKRFQKGLELKHIVNANKL